jgi:hypothetical protein
MCVYLTSASTCWAYRTLCGDWIFSSRRVAKGLFLATIRQAFSAAKGGDTPCLQDVSNALLKGEGVADGGGGLGNIFALGASLVSTATALLPWPTACHQYWHLIPTKCWCRITLLHATNIGISFPLNVGAVPPLLRTTLLPLNVQKPDQSGGHLGPNIWHTISELSGLQPSA